ncbi:MAG: hypothetical protein ABIH84_02975 [bacterium]
MTAAKKSDLQQVKKAIEKHHEHVVNQFQQKHAKTLNFAKKHSVVLAGATVLTAAAIGIGYAHAHEQARHKQQQEATSLQLFVSQLDPLIKAKQTLNSAEEEVIAEALSKQFGLALKVSLEGNRLNEILGYVGKEQHLRRWAGDTLANHDALQIAGMAPLQGAFKDFDNAEQEKYYVAVQLHELPNWNRDWARLKPWYRYRKVFMFNPVNQRGVVAVIGDSGPAKFTGKTFGGSPEVMEYLQMKDGGQKGKAIILFVDDRENKIALGPLSPAAYLASNK